MTLIESLDVLCNELDHLEDDLNDTLDELQRVDAALIAALATILGTANWCEVKGNDRSASFLRERASEIEAMARGGGRGEESNASDRNIRLDPRTEESTS